jgi:transcriptional antiterminator RfaH
MKRWYAVMTQPHAEAKASVHLANQGFAIYFPRYLKQRRHARKVEWIASPLFPRYLFLAMDVETERWRAIRSTVGVVHLVCHGDRPTPVPDAVVAEIRAREDGAGLVSLPRAPGFDRGERVEIRAGALNGQSALFECISDEERVVVLLDLLGRQVRVRLPAETIQAVA